MANFVVVDMRALLDESKVGQQATAGLQLKWKESVARAQLARARPNGADEASTLEREAEKALEASRNALRQKLLDRAREHIRTMATARKATLVLERASVVLCEQADDITADVMSRIDSQGPL